MKNVGVEEEMVTQLAHRFIGSQERFASFDKSFPYNTVDRMMARTEPVQITDCEFNSITPNACLMVPFITFLQHYR